MIARLEEIENKYNELKQELLKPEVLEDYNKIKVLSKEISEYEETVNLFIRYKKVLSDLKNSEDMLSDVDLKEMVEEEIKNLTEEKETLENQLEVLLIPKDKNDGKNVVMEIRGAAGGDEANLFAGDLMRMYSYYAEEHGWKVEVYNEQPGTSGGFSQIECIIKGEGVYSKLKYESGSHRVQRIPVTETQGRVHTSTATVLVMPEVDEVDIEINEKDIKVDVYHSSGAGGQSVNTTNSAVRMTHLPTGIVVTCQSERSQIKNRDQALKMLRVRVYDEITRKQEEEIDSTRKHKIGTGDRSEKIRTYNYPQNRVTDHRINFSIMELDKVMEGKLEPIIEALINEDMKLKLDGETL